MPMREKSAWGSLIATLMAYGLYFAVLLPRFAASPVGQPRFLALLVACVVLLIALQIVFQAGIAITASDQANLPMDERERWIALKSDRIALGVLTTLLASGWLLLLALPDFTPNRAILANTLLFSLVVAAVTKYASQIVTFRRAA
jgi:hypothetical protein